MPVAGHSFSSRPVYEQDDGTIDGPSDDDDGQVGEEDDDEDEDDDADTTAQDIMDKAQHQAAVSVRTGGAMCKGCLVAESAKSRAQGSSK